MTTTSEAQRRALLVLASRLDDGTYLAGGVAIGLSLGHRTSLDLDLFVPHDFDDREKEAVRGPKAEKAWEKAREKAGSLSPS